MILNYKLWSVKYILMVVIVTAMSVLLELGIQGGVIT